MKLARPSPTASRRLCGVVPSFASLLVIAAAAPAEARPVSREDVVRLVTAAPEARAASARASGYREAAEESGSMSLENPEIAGSAGPRLDGGTATLALGVGLSLPVDVFGQRGARIAAAKAEASAAEASARGAALAPLRDALSVHAEALAAKSRRAVFVDRLRLVEELEVAASRKRQAGEVADNEVAVVRLQLGRERAAMAALDGTIAVLEEQLAAVLALPDGERAEASGPLSPADAPTARGPASVAVLAAEAEGAAARARLQRHEAARRPTLRLLGNYELDDTAHIITAGIAIPLPLYGVGNAEVAVARGESAAAALRVAAARRRAGADMRAARLRVASTRRALDATSPSAVEARGIVERAQRAYSAGESDLATLLLVRREALESELAMGDAELAYALAVIEAHLLEGRWTR